MERPNAWKEYGAEQLDALHYLCEGYKSFISDNKTERECCAASIQMAEEAGYANLAERIASGEPLKAGDKVYASNRGKSLMLVHVGTAPLTEGVNILGAHIDSPRLDVKQDPLEERNELVTLDTHYYGGVKKYQWVTMPLAIHGVVAKKDGSVVNVVIGEDEADPVFCISDLLPHLGSQQMSKKASEVIEGEMLDVLVGNRPLVIDAEADGEKDAEAEKSPVKAGVVRVLSETLGIDEEDLLSAELEIVPAGAARDLGLDRSMILGYGQDDRVCAYTSLVAQLDCEAPARTAVTLLVDKEEIGSVGATGMTSHFFEDTMAEVLELAGETGPLALRRCLASSNMLSSDVSAGFDPAFASVFEPKNSAYLGHGLTFNKFTGRGGKGGSNDADAEYVATIRRVMDEGGVHWQTAELGKVDAGGGGTIAYILATYGMNVIDCGVPVLSMHAPWEATSKADVYEAYRGYQEFLKLA
ncbi:aminopeptidase [Thermophilibacter mediterraneus]|uniref:aminopeptidase n=1 Tax=Thermophilibacter mediterraneus TaxID=1871031 RepID=UPI0023547F3B|nr:aminopeptidase [Thermophilibacter mediterraneus]